MGVSRKLSYFSFERKLKEFYLTFKPFFIFVDWEFIVMTWSLRRSCCCLLLPIETSRTNLWAIGIRNLDDRNLPSVHGGKYLHEHSSRYQDKQRFSRSHQISKPSAAELKTVLQVHGRTFCSLERSQSTRINESATMLYKVVALN